MADRSLREFVTLYDDAVPAESCRALIELYDRAAPWRKSSYSGYDGKLVDSSDRVEMNECRVDPGAPFYDVLEKGMVAALDRYADTHGDFSASRSNGFRLNRYGPGGFMSRHVDNIHKSHGQTSGFPIVTCLILLNDDFEGGEFMLFDDWQVPWKRGQALVFPCNFMFPHEVKPVARGVRYSTVTWLL